MHIPDGFLTPRVWGSLDIVSGAFVAVGLRRTSETLQERSIPMMGVLSAFVFAAQMLNLPVAGGTSGHFLGGALVGILLGPWIGLIVMAVILVVQCFLFQDGGVAALGANIFNMGFLGSFVSAYIYRGLLPLMRGSRPRFWAGFATAWITIVLSSLSCAGELAISGVISWGMGLSIIGGVHVVLGLLEGFLTGTVLESLAKTRPDLLKLPLEGK
jgi:cobalt/nickel transport system permease protein